MNLKESVSDTGLVRNGAMSLSALGSGKRNRKLNVRSICFASRLFAGVEHHGISVIVVRVVGETEENSQWWSDEFFEEMVEGWLIEGVIVLKSGWSVVRLLRKIAYEDGKINKIVGIWYQ